MNYSPSISKGLINPLYHKAKQLGIPMTVLVDAYIYQGMSLSPLPKDSVKSFMQYNFAEQHKKYLENIRKLNGDIRYSLREPFQQKDEIAFWKDFSLQGLNKAYSLHAACTREDAYKYHQSYGMYRQLVEQVSEDAMTYVPGGR